ncbi:hypothetical protein HYQ46_010337 [Verticillium longisporum]|nr:hypothetical protein HYQ46_010337 [Verticillium longisporum]
MVAFCDGRPKADRDGVFAARYDSRAFLNDVRAVEERANVLGNSSTRMMRPVVVVDDVPSRERFLAFKPTKLALPALGATMRGGAGFDGGGAFCACLEKRASRSPDLPFSSVLEVRLGARDLGFTGLVLGLLASCFRPFLEVPVFGFVGLGEGVGRAEEGFVGEELRKLSNVLVC